MKKLLLAILAEKSYSMRFAEYLNRHKNMFMELTISTSIEKIEEFCKNNIIDILLVGDNEVCLESLCAGIKKIILLSDGNIVCEKSKHPVIFKYQSADVILRELLTIIAEDEELTNEDFNNGKCYTEPKEQEVEMYDYSNLEPLKDALGIE